MEDKYAIKDSRDIIIEHLEERVKVLKEMLAEEHFALRDLKYENNELLSDVSIYKEVIDKIKSLIVNKKGTNKTEREMLTIIERKWSEYYGR